NVHDAAGLFQAPLWGLGKAVALEHPELRCTRIDLDPTGTVAQAASELADEIRTASGEDQIAFRGGVRHLARLVRAARRDESPQPVRLQASQPGSLDALEWKSVTRCDPGPDEVEICVQAAGLNFRDVLRVLRTESDDALTADGPPLGAECAGRITAVGRRVE